MTTYSESDLNLMTARLYQACGAALSIDAGVLSTPKALMAALKTISSEIDSKASMPLIGALKSHLEKTDPPQDLPAAKDHEKLFGELGALATDLRSKASVEEVNAFRDVVVGAVRAAVSASGGGMMGLGAEVNEAERVFLERIERSMN